MVKCHQEGRKGYYMRCIVPVTMGKNKLSIVLIKIYSNNDEIYLIHIMPILSLGVISHEKFLFVSLWSTNFRTCKCIYCHFFPSEQHTFYLAIIFSLTL
jgi:hypothetical protein